MARISGPVAKILTIAIVSTAIAALSARGRDDSQRRHTFAFCEDFEADPSGPVWTEANCIEGHDCVKCDPAGIIGWTVSPHGQHGKTHNPQVIFDCSNSTRLYGVCFLTAWGTQACDVTGFEPDPEFDKCSGVINIYENQPEGVD